MPRVLSHARRLLLLCLVCLPAFLARPGQAANFSVSTNTDSGAGSLRQAITDITGGANTISWTAGGGGTIFLGSALPIISTNTTLDVTNAFSSVTIAGSGSSAMPLGGAVTFNNSVASSSWTISAVISGTNGSLTQTGAGTLMLTNNNTYGAGTFLNGGILNINNDNNLGNAGSTITFNGGTLQTAVGITSGRGILLNGGSNTFDTNGQASTLNGVISGGGSLAKAGAGTLTLTGINTYTGGTYLNGGTLSISSDAALGNAGGALTFNGGTLRTTTGITSARNITLNQNSGTIDTQGQTSTLTGGIGGSGALIMLGNGTLFLTGSNSYSSGTYINGGTINITQNSGVGSGTLNFNGGILQMASSTMTVSNAITLNVSASSNVIDTLGQNSTLSGIISGAGALTNVSTGTLYLTGANTYSGGTVLSSGTLNIINDSNLGFSTGSVTFNGGILQAGANNIVSSRTITLNAGGVFDTNSYNMVESGVISGNGSLNKIGLGTLTLASANTYTGGTTVSSGTLQLGANNALGTGAVTVNYGGTLDMGSYQQTAASYDGSGGGTLSLMLQQGTTNLTVSGNANLAGGSLKVGIAPQIVTENEQFTPIRAGSFNEGAYSTSSIVSPAAFDFISSAPYISANNLVLTAHLVPFANSAANSNQAAVARILDPLRNNNLTGDMLTVIENLYTLYTGQLQAALDQIGPISLACMRGIGMAGSSAQSAAVSRRMAALADGSDHGGFASYNVNAKPSYPGQLLAYAGSDLSTLGLGDAPAPAGPQSPWGFYGAAVGSTGRLGEATSGSGLQPGYAFNTAGFSGGADYRIDQHLNSALLERRPA